jgi:hypothetical protein
MFTLPALKFGTSAGGCNLNLHVRFLSGLMLPGMGHGLGPGRIPRVCSILTYRCKIVLRTKGKSPTLRATAIAPTGLVLKLGPIPVPLDATFGLPEAK